MMNEPVTETSRYDSGIFSLPPHIEIVLDISRLLSRGLHAMPTGIDRVEMAYAQTLLDRMGDRLQFAAVNPLGIYGRVPRRSAIAFITRLQQRWASKTASSRSWRWARSALDIVRLWPRGVPGAAGKLRYLVQASPNHLNDAAKVRKKLEREEARFICLVFDLIPILYPEYGRADGAEKHLARIHTLMEHADGLVAISEAVARSLEPYAAGRRKPPALCASLLGVDLPEVLTTACVHVPRPYFIFVSTIEPRKNHLLLLHIWRRMVETLGPELTPHLVIVGRRGWENENIVDLLDRCEAIRTHVTELQGLPDEALFPLIAGARAMLFPSFAEGFGMPVAEALALGTPVICSDIQALREAGQDIPDYLDPLDGPSWIHAVLDYSRSHSQMRVAQLERMKGWRTPTWSAHIDGVLQLITELD